MPQSSWRHTTVARKEKQWRRRDTLVAPGVASGKHWGPWVSAVGLTSVGIAPATPRCVIPTMVSVSAVVLLDHTETSLGEFPDPMVRVLAK